MSAESSGCLPRSVLLLRLAALLGIGVLLSAGAAGAKGTSAADLSLEQLLEVRVRIGTGSPQTLAQVPAVASVFTAQQFEASGATELTEFLEEVPGLHVRPVPGRGLDPAFAIRGLNTNGVQALLLIDGIPVPQLLIGGSPVGLRIPVVSIERVEIVRGPGSALYGADAFAGVINVITKTEAPTAQVGARAGSFGFRNAWAEASHRWEKWRLYFGLDWREGDGDADRIVAADLQTGLDASFGTAASLAPGPLATEHRLFDFHLALSRPGWTARAWSATSRFGNGAGLAGALDREGFFESRILRFDVQGRSRPRPNLEITQSVHGSRVHGQPDYRLTPPGSVLPIGADGNLNFVEPVAAIEFPEGLIGRPSAEQLSLGYEAAATYEGIEDHRFRLALGACRQEVDTSETKNFGPGVLDPSVPGARPMLTDVSGTEFIFLQDRERDLIFFSAQDVWSVAPDWELTAGIRADHYSDFGDTVNPRLALVWSATDKTTAKLLYGRAFRGPSFGQQFGINSLQLGNPELEPETVEMLELAVELRPTARLRAATSIFRYQAEDLIELVPVPDQPAVSQTRNARDQDGMGAEFELQWEPDPRVDVEANVAWVEVTSSGEGLRDFPGLQAFFAVDWRFGENWASRLRGTWVSERDRAPGDARGPLDDYFLADLVVRRRGALGPLDGALQLTNLTDENAREPAGVVLPGDIPLPGRSVRVSASYRF